MPHKTLLIASAIFIFSPTHLFAETVTPKPNVTAPDAPPARLAPQELLNCVPPAQPTTTGAAPVVEERESRRAAEQAGLSREEVLARLIFSESLSSGFWKGRCHAPSDDELMTSIGWGIMNRVAEALSRADINDRATARPYYDTIFMPNQFRTSFSGKKKAGNPFAVAFLCSLKASEYLRDAQVKVESAELFSKAQAVAGRIVREFDKDKIPKRYEGITNFFYPHSEFFGDIRPKGWAQDPNPLRNKGYVNFLGVDRPCAEFYRLGPHHP